MMLEITLIKSPIGRPPKHRVTVKTLGLTKMHKTVRLEETPEVVGMINAFTLGLQRVNPEATVKVVWLNSWFDPARAQERYHRALDVIEQRTLGAGDLDHLFQGAFQDLV